MPTQTWQRVRIIMLTTYDQDEQIFAALRMGASGYLVKDTGTEELLHAITVVAVGEAPSAVNGWVHTPGRSSAAVAAARLRRPAASCSARRLIPSRHLSVPDQ